MACNSFSQIHRAQIFSHRFIHTGYMVVKVKWRWLQAKMINFHIFNYIDFLVTGRAINSPIFSTSQYKGCLWNRVFTFQEWIDSSWTNFWFWGQSSVRENYFCLHTNWWRKLGYQNYTMNNIGLVFIYILRCSLELMGMTYFSTLPLKYTVSLELEFLLSSITTLRTVT